MKKNMPDNVLKKSLLDVCAARMPSAASQFTLPWMVDLETYILDAGYRSSRSITPFFSTELPRNIQDAKTVSTMRVLAAAEEVCNAFNERRSAGYLFPLMARFGDLDVVEFARAGNFSKCLTAFCEASDVAPTKLRDLEKLPLHNYIFAAGLLKAESSPEILDRLKAYHQNPDRPLSFGALGNTPTWGIYREVRNASLDERRFMRHFTHVSERQMQILLSAIGALGEVMSLKDISESLGITPASVDDQRKEAVRKARGKMSAEVQKEALDLMAARPGADLLCDLLDNDRRAFAKIVKLEASSPIARFAGFLVANAIQQPVREALEERIPKGELKDGYEFKDEGEQRDQVDPSDDGPGM